MRLFIDYLKAHMGGLTLFVCCTAGYGAVLYLYGVDFRAIAYCIVLFCVVLLTVTVLDFLAFAQKHRTLTNMAKEPLLIDSGLPQTMNLIEEDYKSIISSLNDLRKSRESEYAKRYEKMLEYYATWAHQIKTPIAAASLILNDIDDTAEGRELKEELFRIEQYVEMVLCYLKLEGDGSDFLFRECSLDAIIRGAVKKFAPQFIRRRIGLVYEGTDRSALTDEKWLSFVLEQVISNALKYTEKGRVTISVNDGNTLSICDTGIGIAEEDLPRIFERGFTGYNGHTDKKSTGIGLHLCRSICSALGHEIEARSRVGAGTEILIHLGRRDMGTLE